MSEREHAADLIVSAAEFWRSLSMTPYLEANAFLTSDCEIPNCRAMRDGVMPALKAARIAFSFPDVKAIGVASTCCRLRGFLPDGTFLPRRFCSASMAESNRSRSRSSSRLTALAKSLGKICRADEVAVVALAIGDEGRVPGKKPPGRRCVRIGRVSSIGCARCSYRG